MKKISKLLLLAIIMFMMTGCATRVKVGETGLKVKAS